MNKKDLERFLGLANIYNRYIPKFLDLIQPFVNLRKKKSEFKWGEKQDIAFNRVKKELMKKSVVKVFDPKKEIVHTTDATKLAVSAILSQNGYPFMYLSRKLTSAKANYFNTGKEALVIVWSLKRVRQFLLS